MKSDIVSSFLFKETLEETCNLAHSSSDCQRAIAPLQSLCRDYDRGSRGNGFEDHGFVWVDYKKISTIVGGNRNQNECGLRTPDVAVLDSKQPPQCKQGKVRFCPSFAMDYREWQDPFCQRQEAVNCASLLETSCKAQSSSCTRTPGSSSSTHTLKCVKADGSQATGCKDTWTKPQCPPANNPPPNNSGGQTTPTTQNRKITLSTMEDISSSSSFLPNFYAVLGDVALEIKNFTIDQVGSDRYDLIIPVGDNQQFRSAYGQAMVVNGAYNQHHDQYKDIGLQGIIIRATVNMHNPVNGESCLPWLRFNLTSQFNTSSHTASSEYIDGSWGYNSNDYNAAQCTSKKYPSNYPRLISL